MNFRSAARLWLLTQQALREVLHLRLAWAFAGSAVGLTAAASLLRELNFGAEEARFLCDLGEGTLMLFGVVLAVVLPVTLIQLRPARDAVELLQMHRVRRYEWLLSRAMASWVALLWLALVLQGLVAVLLWRYGHLVPLLAFVGNGGVSALRLVIVACLAVAMSALVRGPVLAACLTMALTLAAQLSPIIAWAEQHGSGTMRSVWSIVDWALLDFSAVGVSAPQLAYVAGYIVLYLTLACWTFSRREL
ncbi:MAG TPA: hypothetical protein VFJ90_14255 [Candidatus Didemnitutus sp.]|nr:hypothetical protein [Candidatus Didemnitutus sp.]